MKRTHNEEQEGEEEAFPILDQDEDYDFDETNAFYDSVRDTHPVVKGAAIPSDLIQFMSKELSRIANNDQLRVAKKLRTIKTKNVKVVVPDELEDVVLNEKRVNYKTQLLIEQSFYDKRAQDTIVSKRLEFCTQFPYIVASSVNSRHPLFAIPELVQLVKREIYSKYDIMRLRRTCKLLYHHKLLVF
jgi:hypothetical protein